ncbi:MAG: DUF1570 domain-containing protein [Patescibacteria group bacterium]|nr:DUF1570 domain-containing protein [Patescibacteria group bacterium]
MLLRRITLSICLAAGWLNSSWIAGQTFPASKPAPLGGNDWPLELVETLDGRQYQGLIESQDDYWLRMIRIFRPAGREMYLVIQPVEAAGIARIERLVPDRRELLRRRIHEFRSRAVIEAGRMDAVRLSLVERDGLHFHRYRGRWFELESTADEPTTRRIIVRTDQVFTAFRQLLPARVEPPRPPRILVLSSMEEYRGVLARLGLQIENPACYLREPNLVVVGSDLARHAATLAGIESRHREIRAELDELQRALPDRLAALGTQLRQQGHPRAQATKLLLIERRKIEDQIAEKQRELDRCDRENAETFRQIARRMFVRLYHEAFHAYLENYAYPEAKHRVPMWLNEGLAVLFSGGLLESETLRVDAPNREALDWLRADLRGASPLPLAQLTELDQRGFLLVDHVGAAAQRNYVYAWGLTYYLAFERRLLDGPAFEAFVAPSGGTSPTVRLETLVGAPLAEFEPAWRTYMTKLR